MPESEQWDEKNRCFVYTKEQALQLEHSLVSVSKWESKWEKSFFSKEPKTFEETTDYIRCMTLTQNVDPFVYGNLTDDNIGEINKYVEASMTATCFYGNKVCGVSREKITSELIYYWMIALGIPFECQKWHLNRLITLIRVCDIKNQPAKKMGNGDVMRRNAALNAERRKMLNTKG